MNDANHERVARIRSAAMAHRSKLYRWLRDHYEEFFDALEEAGRPDWTALAKAFGDEGLTDAEGKAPTPQGARQTWLRVRRAVEMKGTKPRKPAPEPRKAPQSKPHLDVRPGEPPQFEFRPSKPKDKK